MHPNINFTVEHENDGKLPFLDVLVSKMNGKFITSVFRKDSFSGQGTNYFSWMFQKYKASSITTLLCRAYAISSSAIDFREEVIFLRKYFVQNNYTTKFFNSCLQKFLSKKLDFIEKVETVPKLAMYFELPFTGRSSSDVIKELTKIIITYTILM